jgi:thiamine-phosphate pyrophosphorylase
LDDRHLTEQFKCLRHDLVAVLAAVPLRHRLAARETERDVGTGITTRSERSRHDPSAVLTANFTRLQEALRSLEEFGKVLDPQIGSGVERIRYRTYTLQKAVEATRTGLERLHSARLYVLIDGRASADEFAALAHALVGAGVHVLQLRDKRLDDRRLVERARLLRQVTRGSGTLLVVNDRPDVAVLAEADGVHLGQEELTVNDARTLIGPEPLVGVSAHSIEQARQAVLDGANYLGVGPTFPSQTKGFHDYPGPPLLKAVAAEISLPAFAIGGISLENMGQTLASGFHRIAVGAAVTSAPDPARAARDLLAALV